jgi:RecJ-like exonuclease
MHFPKTGSRAIQDPTPRDYPQIKIGTVVRLRGKPNSQRRVIKTE